MRLRLMLTMFVSGRVRKGLGSPPPPPILEQLHPAGEPDLDKESEGPGRKEGGVPPPLHPIRHTPVGAGSPRPPHPRPPIRSFPAPSPPVLARPFPVPPGLGARGLLLGLLLFLAFPAAHAAPADATVYVDTDTPVVQNYTGAGVQWDPSDYAYTDAQWDRIFRRVDVLRPQFIRCCLTSDFYCTGFDAQGRPVYDWDTAQMGRLYKILDYCQSHHVEVLLGEWGPSFGMDAADPRWSRLIGDCLEHLVRAKGYTCVRYYNKQNEPTGDQAAFERWKASQESLDADLHRRGLNRQVALVGPDTSGTDLLWWADSAASELPQTLGVYEVHWYAQDDEITGGLVEKSLRRRRGFAAAHDSAGRAKPFLVAEAGTSDTMAALTGDWNSGDSNTKIRDFGYGVFMADYLLQTMRAGVGGVSAWDLDDSMHTQAKIAPTAANPNAYSLKVWGFWNTFGGAMGKPEDENLRPWFYSWSLLCRAFPRGMKIVSVSGTTLPGVRVAAATRANGGKDDISLAVVNDSDTPRTVRVVVPNAAGRAVLREFHYFDGDRPTDANGFPVAERVLPGVSLAAGLAVRLPSRGLVLLTTLGGSPVALTSGVKPPVSAVTVQAAQVTRGETLPMEAAVVPDNGAVRWSVSGLDGRPTALATITPSGLLTARGLGRVRLTATAKNGIGRDIKASAPVSITDEKVVVDDMVDWSKTDSHIGGWFFETIHPDVFEGAASHLKRVSDTPESLTYHLYHLSDFTARVYFTDALADKVRFYVSADGGRWTPLTVQNDSPVPTGGTFFRTNFRPLRVPEGTDYLRIEFAHDAKVYSPQLGQVRLVSSAAGH